MMVPLPCPIQAEAEMVPTVPRGGQEKSCPAKRSELWPQRASQVSFARGSLSFQLQVCKTHPQDPEEDPSKGVPCGWPREQLCCQVGSAPCQQSLSPAPARRLERPPREGPPRQGGRSGHSWMESKRRAAGSSSRPDSTTSPSGSLEEILGVEVEVGCVGGCFRWTPHIPGFPVGREGGAPDTEESSQMTRLKRRL